MRTIWVIFAMVAAYAAAGIGVNWLVANLLRKLERKVLTDMIYGNSLRVYPNVYIKTRLELIAASTILISFWPVTETYVAVHGVVNYLKMAKEDRTKRSIDELAETIGMNRI